MKAGIIHYGFGKDYLPKWGLKEALREIYQNFLDYGEYEDIQLHLDNKIEVTVQNAWQPESLDFLRIGNSQKTNPNSIGKHGEGLKMAFLILLREGYASRIMTPRHAIYPAFYNDAEIGECFCLEYEEHGLDQVQFGIKFECDHQTFKDFKANIITSKDVVYDDHYFGQIVSKPVGNIYSGGLFVANVDNLKNAYNINPAHLPLDRDRSVPASFDVNWAASKILESQGKLTAKDLSYSDATYVSRIPDSVKATIRPRVIGNSIQYTFKGDDGKTEVISNNSVKDVLKNDSFFASMIKKLKKVIAKQLGLYDLLIEFQKKHVHSQEAKIDFELILEKVDK